MKYHKTLKTARVKNVSFMEYFSLLVTLLLHCDEDSALTDCSLSLLFIWIKPIREETVPSKPTSQLGNCPAQRKPGGIQWMALLMSAVLLRMESSSPCICLQSWECLQEKTDRFTVSGWVVWGGRNTDVIFT